MLLKIKNEFGKKKLKMKYKKQSWNSKAFKNLK